MQEIMCACAGKPLQSIHRGCTAMMMRLLRSEYNGCYVCKHRSDTLHLLCLETVKLGDSKLEAYSLAMEKLRDVKAALEPVAAVFEGLGLSDSEMAADSVGSGIGHKKNFVMTDSAHSGSHCLDGFAAWSRKWPVGGPATGRDEAPYEQPH
ncbi:uncharacterized protein LOC119367423 [Triticum dicoccoides]|uniref:uncharacterized protein LOC119367423 n=1 Tax=Triticum dicoccoides TaxID=85692 RepID=UPI00188EA611|nr:uncharacterized protein LOC119367423 [Triticum dicoccoides]